MSSQHDLARKTKHQTGQTWNSRTKPRDTMEKNSLPYSQHHKSYSARHQDDFQSDPVPPPGTDPDFERQVQEHLEAMKRNPTICKDLEKPSEDMYRDDSISQDPNDANDGHGKIELSRDEYYAARRIGSSDGKKNYFQHAAVKDLEQTSIRKSSRFSPYNDTGGITSQMDAHRRIPKNFAKGQGIRNMHNPIESDQKVLEFHKRSISSQIMKSYQLDEDRLQKSGVSAADSNTQSSCQGKSDIDASQLNDDDPLSARTYKKSYTNLDGIPGRNSDQYFTNKNDDRNNSYESPAISHQKSQSVPGSATSYWGPGIPDRDDKAHAKAQKLKYGEELRKQMQLNEAKKKAEKAEAASGGGRSLAISHAKDITKIATNSYACSAVASNDVHRNVAPFGYPFENGGFSGAHNEEVRSEYSQSERSVEWRSPPHNNYQNRPSNQTESQYSGQNENDNRRFYNASNVSSEYSNEWRSPPDIRFQNRDSLEKCRASTESKIGRDSNDSSVSESPQFSNIARQRFVNDVYGGVGMTAALGHKGTQGVSKMRQPQFDDDERMALERKRAEAKEQKLALELQMAEKQLAKKREEEVRKHEEAMESKRLYEEAELFKRKQLEEKNKKQKEEEAHMLKLQKQQEMLLIKKNPHRRKDSSNISASDHIESSSVYSLDKYSESSITTLSPYQHRKMASNAQEVNRNGHQRSPRERPWTTQSGISEYTPSRMVRTNSYSQNSCISSNNSIDEIPAGVAARRGRMNSPTPLDRPSSVGMSATMKHKDFINNPYPASRNSSRNSPESGFKAIPAAGTQSNYHRLSQKKVFQGSNSSRVPLHDGTVSSRASFDGDVGSDMPDFFARPNVLEESLAGDSIMIPIVRRKDLPKSNRAKVNADSGTSLMMNQSGGAQFRTERYEREVDNCSLPGESHLVYLSSDQRSANVPSERKFRNAACARDDLSTITDLMEKTHIRDRSSVQDENLDNCYEKAAVYSVDEEWEGTSRSSRNKKQGGF